MKESKRQILRRFMWAWVHYNKEVRLTYRMHRTKAEATVYQDDAYGRRIRYRVKQSIGLNCTREATEFRNERGQWVAVA